MGAFEPDGLSVGCRLGRYPSKNDVALAFVGDEGFAAEHVEGGELSVTDKVSAGQQETGDNEA